jgi:xanthine dehydrogenase accessory factor
MTQASDNMARVALDYIAQGKGAALATVISTWGSAPRPVGSQLAIADDGAFQGSVSGGCVEGAVILAAQDALQDGKCRVLDYGVADADAFAVGLACGGNIQILVEPIGLGDGPDQALIEEMAKALETRKAYAYQVNLETWVRQPLDAAGLVPGKQDNLYIHVVNPGLRMIIVGAVHVTQTLAPLARMAGYAVTLVDPRDSFSTHERFPDDTFIDAWPDEALRNVGLDAHTAVITLSHDPKIDTPALAVALQSDVFYIGALGSRKTHAKRVVELQGQGFTDVQIARIHGPIGLNIGAKTPAEIAISIMAEVTERLRRP